MGEVSKVGFSNKVTANLERHRVVENTVKAQGYFTVKHYDKDGKLLGEYRIPNGVTNVGKNALLDIMFDADTQITVWYLGHIDSSGYTGIAAADTMASHAGWTEFVAYNEATRPIWNPDAASSQTIVNSVTVDFNITGAGTLKGVFCVSENTKSGAAGTLWATALFTTPIPVSNGDLLKLTYTVQAS